jgi:hypothetical protein
MCVNLTGVNGSEGTAPIHPATRLRQLIHDKEIIIAPGVYDGFSARIAQEVGFDCLYMVRHPILPYCPAWIPTEVYSN